MKRPRQLSASFVSTVKVPGRYGDGRGGHGISLLVRESSTGRLSKSWAQRLRIAGQPFNVGLGSYPLIALAKARERALGNARLVAEGGDPRIPVPTIPTFAEAVDRVIEIHSEGWKHEKTEKRWRSTIEAYAMPVLGSKLVSEVTSADVMAILMPIWVSKHETAEKTRERVGVVMKWAVAQGYRNDNPAGPEIIKALPKTTQRAEHFRALPFSEVGKAINKVRATNAWWATQLSLEFLTLTAARSGEARLATWSEINEKTSTWVIPKVRMKQGFEHRVPLSLAALAVLEQARELSDGTGFVFPSPTGKALTDSTMSKLLRDNNIGCVPHGMRSSFRDWAAECSDVPREIAEHALAHVEGSASELAYRRTDYFEKRRELMEDWSDYVQGNRVLTKEHLE